MKKTWVILSAVVLFILLALSLIVLDRSELYSEVFQKRMVAEVARQLHWDLKLQKIHIKPLKGVDLVEVSVSSKDIRPHEFLKAQKMRLRYNLWDAITKRRIILDEFRLDAPSMEIDLSPPEGNQNPPSAAAVVQKEKINQLANGTEPSSTGSDAIQSAPNVENGTASTDDAAIHSVPPVPPTPPKVFKKYSFWPAPKAIDLHKILVDDGIFSLTLPNRDQLFLTGTHIEASLSADPVPTGTGTIICQSARIAKTIQLSESRCNFLWRADTLSIPKFSATTFNGVVEGNINADQSKPTTPFDVQLVATNLNLHEIVETFDEGRKRLWGEVHGDVQTRMRFQGSMLEPIQASGQGIVQITDLRVFDSPGLVLIAGLLNRPDLKDLHPQKCEMDFILQSAKIQIPRIEVISPDIQLTGNGWINLLERNNEFQLKLAMSEELSKRIPAEVLQGLERRVDGFIEIPFRVWGPNDNPQNDLESRFAKIATRAVGGAIFDKIFQSIKTQSK